MDKYTRPTDKIMVSEPIDRLGSQLKPAGLFCSYLAFHLSLSYEFGGIIA